MTCLALQQQYLAAINADPVDHDEVNRLHAELVGNGCEVPANEGEGGGSGGGPRTPPNPL